MSFTNERERESATKTLVKQEKERERKTQRTHLLTSHPEGLFLIAFYFSRRAFFFDSKLVLALEITPGPSGDGSFSSKAKYCNFFQRQVKVSSLQYQIQKQNQHQDQVPPFQLLNFLFIMLNVTFNTSTRSSDALCTYTIATFLSLLFSPV